MKSKILLAIFVLIFTISTVALADFVSDTGLSNNTGAVLKIGPAGTHTTYEKVGTWEGAPNNTEQVTALGSGSTGGSYAGNADHNKGFFAEKLYIPGATKIIKRKDGIGGDLVTMVYNKNGTSFDQWVNTATFEYPLGTSYKYAKGVEAILFGRMLGKIAITNDDDIVNRQKTPNYSLELQAESGNAFKPTTNIGLGNKCNLYAYDIGTAVNDGGGCPVGSYISYYKAPGVSGTPTASNNVNGVVIATCTQINPSASPTTTACNPGYSFVTTNQAYEKNCQMNVSPFTINKAYTCNFNETNLGNTGKCKFDITVTARSAKNPQARYTNFGPGSTSSYTGFTSTYSKTGNCTGDYDSFEVIDDYGQYYKWSV